MVSLADLVLDLLSFKLFVIIGSFFSSDVEKLTKMKNLLDILSNPNKRMPLETLIKCEVVLEKLDFKRSEGVGVVVGLPPGKVRHSHLIFEMRRPDDS